MARTRRSIKTPVGRSTVKFFVVPRKIIKTGLGVALTLTLFYLYSLVACDRRRRPARRETHLPINVTVSQGLMSQRRRHIVVKIKARRFSEIFCKFYLLVSMDTTIECIPSFADDKLLIRYDRN